MAALCKNESMSELIDFKIRIADLTARITCKQEQTRAFCRDYIVDGDDFDIWVETLDEGVASEIARHGEGGTAQFFEKIYVYRQIAEKLPYYNRFAFHGATVEVDGKGYIFAAPSGTGKSTHVSLLKKYFGDRVTVINGDKPIIKVGEDCIEVCSCPWCGKEGWQTNKQTPLGGIVLLERAEENSIKKIEPSEYLEKLVLQTFVPEDGESFLRILDLMDKVSKSVPFYLLECNISDEAAKTSFEMMTDGI